MKYIKKFNEGFEPIVAQRKLSDNFKKTADSVLDMIESDESLHYLKDMAKEVKADGSEGWSTAERDCVRELKLCFPEIDFGMQEHLKTGFDIPFYGRTGSIGIGGNPSETVTLSSYIIGKLGGWKQFNEELDSIETPEGIWREKYKRPTYKESGKVLQHPEGADEYGDCLTCGKTRLIIFNEPRKMCSCGYANKTTD